MFYVYILKSKVNGQIYCGSTVDLKARFKQHNDGKVFSTKRYMPWEIIYYEAFFSETLARVREQKLKYNGNAMHELKKRLNLLKPKSGAGFTLLELLISAAMLALLSAVTVVNFRTSESSRQVKFAADYVANTIRSAQNYALTGKSLTTDCADSSPQYFIADFNATEFTLYGIDKCNRAVIVDKPQLPDRTRLKSGGLYKNNSTVPKLMVRYDLPFARATVSTDSTIGTGGSGPSYAFTQGTFTTFTTAQVTVENTRGTLPRVVTVDGITGRIGE